MTESSQITLGRALLKRLVALREEKGDMSVEDVGAMFIEMAQAVNPNAAVAQEIERLASYINEAKKEIFAITTNDKAEQVITDASQHLDEVIKATEEATHIIMDAADSIQNAAGGVGGDKEKQIMDGTNRIYEACNFQDITGQRITKVIKLLANIEERIGKLIGLLGNSGQPATGEVRPMTDQDLLNGPQLKGRGATQAEIDALLAGMGGN